MSKGSRSRENPSVRNKSLRRFFWKIPLMLLYLAYVPIPYAQGGAEHVFFGIELGNSWNYQGQGYVWRDEVAFLDEDTFSPHPTYIIDSFEDGFWSYSEWVEVRPGQLLEWGSDDGYEFWGYSDPFLMAWYPLAVGDHRHSEATLDAYTSVSMTVDVLAKEAVDLGFDVFEAHKMLYAFTIIYTDPDDPEASFEDTYLYNYWIVPYLGKIKYQDDEYTEVLTSFAILGGTVTQDTDTDRDCLKDYQELVFHETDRENADTDDDGFSDFVEVQAGSNPLEESSVPLCPGDLDQDGRVDVADLVLFAGNYGKPGCDCPCKGDFNGVSHVDGKDLSIFAEGFNSVSCL